MTALEFIKALNTIGWTQRQLSIMLGCDHNLPARWAADSAKIPPSIAHWLDRLARAHIAYPTPRNWRTK